ncbi:hypothetical protein [Mycolicibacterium moriokaense]|uniref:PASTA domain-containing protein n=1 Tax=Mycolicibacterium moriokaense TaxID=39691 RepID=A0A318HRE6_9MYCO|nr:hypothetical protein [Mycolicibacterium moriokaense]PXX07235.1 hypothetical protein C8E89_11118 [Mycolicibacterium moriokaense]
MSCTRSILGASATAAAIAVLGLAGSGVAAAATTDVTGQKYSDAQSALSSAGLKPVVEIVVGDRKSWPDCVVTRAQSRTVPPPANSGGSATKEMLVSLNCEASIASATAPGNSAASPEGKAAIAAAASSSSSGGSS